MRSGFVRQQTLLLLLVPILAETLLPLVRGNLMSLPFATAGHVVQDWDGTRSAVTGCNRSSYRQDGEYTRLGRTIPRNSPVKTC